MYTNFTDIDRNFISTYSKSHAEQDWLTEFRLSSFEKFKTMEVPVTKYGTGIVMDTSGLQLEALKYKKDFPQSDTHFNKDVTVVKLHKADESIRDYLGSLVGVENKHLALHYALCEGYIIVVPNNKKTLPLKINTFLEHDLGFNHFLIIVGDNAEIDIIEDGIDYGKPGFKTNVIEIFAGKNSKVNYVTAQKLNPTVHSYTIKRAKLEQNATVNWFNCIIGGAYTSMEHTSILAGEGATSRNHGVFVGMGDEQYDLLNTSIHQAPHTTSEILTKGVVKDRAKALCRGSIEIKHGAPSSDAHQHADVLIMNKGAEANAVPELKIDNNNVKCSHGSTIGQFDSEKLFYLMTRSLSESAAKHIMVEGFLEPMLGTMKNIDYLKEDVYKRIA